VLIAATPQHLNTSSFLCHVVPTDGGLRDTVAV